MITVSVKGEPLFGFPRHAEKIEIEEPGIECVMEHLNIDPKIRKHLLVIINNKIGNSSQILNDGDELTFQSPYSGG